MPDSERIVRGTVSQAKDKNLRELQVELQDDEVRDNLEHMEPYGFTSEPFLDEQTDAVIAFTDDSREHGLVICVADRRYRLKALKKGEVAMYDDLGRKIYLRREGILIDGASSKIDIKTSTTVNINASASVNVTTSNVSITSPETTISGHVTIKGGLNVSGGSGAAVEGSLTTTGDVVANSISLDNHVHTGVQPGGGNTGGPQ